MGGLLGEGGGGGGQRVMLAPSKIIGGPGPPSSYAYVLILMHSEQPKLRRVLAMLRAIELNVT